MCDPTMDTPGAFLVIHRHVLSGEKFELLDAHILSGGCTGQHFAFLFQLSACKQVFFLVGPFVPPFFCIFLCFSLVISLFKRAPTCGATVLSGVLSTEGCDVPYGGTRVR